MASVSTKTLKVAIELHQGEESTKKIWRFNADAIHKYSRNVVEAEILSLFPVIHAKGLGLYLYHFDEIAGKIHIESDGDLQEALTNFTEEWHGARRNEFLVLHACDTTRIIDSTADVQEPAHPSITSRKSRKVSLIVMIV